MKLKELVLKNRSYRRFDETVILGDAELRAMVDHARLSGSGANLQPLRYLLVTTPTMRNLLFPHLRWAGYLKHWNGPEPGERPTGYIVMLVDRGAGKFIGYDAGIAMQSILLAATEMGFGGCAFASFDAAGVDAAVSGLVDLERYRVELILALGKPSEAVRIAAVEGNNIRYFRDEKDVHVVPKRALEDIVLGSV